MKKVSSRFAEIVATHKSSISIWFKRIRKSQSRCTQRFRSKKKMHIPVGMRPAGDGIESGVPRI